MIYMNICIYCVCVYIYIYIYIYIYDIWIYVYIWYIGIYVYRRKTAAMKVTLCNCTYMYVYNCMYMYCHSQNNWRPLSWFQRFPSSKLVLITVESCFVALNYYGNGSTFTPKKNSSDEADICATVCMCTCTCVCKRFCMCIL
jgi:hypothetical protein